MAGPEIPSPSALPVRSFRSGSPITGGVLGQVHEGWSCGQGPTIRKFVARERDGQGGRFFRPLRGLRPFSQFHPRLAPWAAFFRCFAAGVGLSRPRTRKSGQSSRVTTSNPQIPSPSALPARSFDQAIRKPAESLARFTKAGLADGDVFRLNRRRCGETGLARGPIIREFAARERDGRGGRFFSPLRGLRPSFAIPPTACAVGCILSPLRGWGRPLSTANSKIGGSHPEVTTSNPQIPSPSARPARFFRSRSLKTGGPFSQVHEG